MLILLNDSVDGLSVTTPTNVYCDGFVLLTPLAEIEPRIFPLESNIVTNVMKLLN